MVASIAFSPLITVRAFVIFRNVKVDWFTIIFRRINIVLFVYLVHPITHRLAPLRRVLAASSCPGEGLRCRSLCGPWRAVYGLSRGVFRLWLVSWSWLFPRPPSFCVIAGHFDCNHFNLSVFIKDFPKIIPSNKMNRNPRF